MNCSRIPALVLFAVLHGLSSQQAASAPIVVHYSVADTGQMATAGFEFLGDSTLQIVVTETTPAGSSVLSGGSAILTRVGFSLPDVEIAGGTVRIAPGSASIGFSDPELPAGTDVSPYWGFTTSTLSVARLRDAIAQDAEEERLRARAKAQRDAAAQLLANNPDAQMRADAADLIRQAELDEAAAASAHNAAIAARAEAAALESQADAWQFIGVLQEPPLPGAPQGPLTPFLTAPGGLLIALDGVQGGLIHDAAARGRNAAIVDSAVITLQLADALLPEDQNLFLRNVIARSIVEYGNGSAFTFAQARQVPEPALLSLLSVILGILGFMRPATPRSSAALPASQARRPRCPKSIADGKLATESDGLRGEEVPSRRGDRRYRF